MRDHWKSMEHHGKTNVSLGAQPPFPAAGGSHGTGALEEGIVLPQNPLKHWKTSISSFLQMTSQN